MPQVKRRMGAVEWVLLIILSIVWGGSFFFSTVALAELGPLTVVMSRVILAALVLNLIVRITGQRLPRDWHTWGMFLVLGTSNNVVPFTLIFWAETVIPSGLASVLNATSPLFAAILAHLLTRDERLTANRLRGVLVGIVAVVVIVGPSALQAVGGQVLPQAAVLVASLSYAVAGIFAKRFRELSSLVVATCQVTCSSLIMTPLALLVDRPWLGSMPGMRTLGALLILGIICTAVGYIIYFRLLSTSGATNAILVTLMVPVSAVLLGALFLHEPVLLRQVLGMLLLAVGLLTIDGRPGAWLRERLGRARRGAASAAESE